MYLPMPNNHYVTDSSHLLMQPGNNYTETNAIAHEYSPDNSSYSENSDYTTTSDDYFEDESTMGEKGQMAKQQLQHPQHEMYSPHQSTYISSGSEMMHVMPSMSPASSCSPSNTLPPFPTINSTCDGHSGSSYKQDGLCHSYQDSGAMHLNPYSTYSTIHTDSHPLPQHTSVYSYDIHGSAHYAYSNGFQKDDSFALIGTAGSHLSSEPSLSSEQVNSSLSTQLLTEDNTNIGQQPQPQQYIDLSLSIASSSSAESLLSAANTSDEDSRLTPVSFTSIQPLSSSAAFYAVTGGSGCVDSLCQSSFDQSYLPKGLIGECASVAPFTDANESDPKSDSSPENDLSSSEHFGEIIKKSILETVSA